jgi:hypothetical protein
VLSELSCTFCTVTLAYITPFEATHNAEPFVKRDQAGGVSFASNTFACNTIVNCWTLVSSVDACNTLIKCWRRRFACPSIAFSVSWIWRTTSCGITSTKRLLRARSLASRWMPTTCMASGGRGLRP